MSHLQETAIRLAIRETLIDINQCIGEIERQAKRLGTEPHILRDSSGNWVLAPLLCAKAQMVHSYALLHSKKEGQCPLTTP